MTLIDSYEVTGSGEQKGQRHITKWKSKDIQGYLSSNGATQTFSAAYTTRGFIYFPCLSLFRVHWRELMSHNLSSRWLIFTKRSNYIASPFFNSLSETLPVLFPVSQIPLFHLVILSIAESSKPSVSVKAFPNTLALRISLSQTV